MESNHFYLTRIPNSYSCLNWIVWAQKSQSFACVRLKSRINTFSKCFILLFWIYEFERENSFSFTYASALSLLLFPRSKNWQSTQVAVALFLSAKECRSAKNKWIANHTKRNDVWQLIKIHMLERSGKTFDCLFDEFCCFCSCQLLFSFFFVLCLEIAARQHEFIRTWNAHRMTRNVSISRDVLWKWQCFIIFNVLAQEKNSLLWHNWLNLMILINWKASLTWEYFSLRNFNFLHTFASMLLVLKLCLAVWRHSKWNEIK